jgi:hypothetical protein
MSESQDKPQSAINRLGNTSAEITFNNMTKLCNQDQYEVAGVTYKRKILKPKELVALYKLQAALDKIEDPEKRMDNLYQQAQICLEGITKENWEKTDAVYMEIVLGACLLISKGFRSV